MKKLIVTSATLLTVAAIILISCNKDKLTGGSPEVNVASGQKQIRQEYTITSGTSDHSKDGYVMNVSLKEHEDNGNGNGNAKSRAVIDTKYFADMGGPQKVQMDFGPLDIHEALLKDSMVISVDSFKNIVVHKLNIPQDGKKYWMVPFDPKGTPTPTDRLVTAGSGVSIGCCCGGGDGCYVSDAGQCLTKVCLKCTNNQLAIDAKGNASIRALDMGFALVQADIITFNGVKYQ